MPVEAGRKERLKGDFVSLLKESGIVFPFSAPAELPTKPISERLWVESTTILAFYYKEGVIVAGDRRATAGNLVIHERAEKVISIDRNTILAIAGTPATAFEIARVLQHSFEFYRRSQLQPLSVAAKVRMVSKLLKDNMALSLQGIGIVVPLLALADPFGKEGPTIYFYDALGAQFQTVDFAASGSGSPAVRSILQYINRWSGKPSIERNEEEAIRLALQLLDIAAESDTATGGVNRRNRIFPQVKLLKKSGVVEIAEERLAELFAEVG
ncbi:proteasome subunit alpha [Candidatus Methylacidiphilum fumarolicum]|nr:proteasome subunit alpha [Candidatus Methylacidiphilum fumarolicum]TFE74729.1 proteasome subunit alpha [Candidatus Methylacidiphilum fumarolicum]